MTSDHYYRFSSKPAMLNALRPLGMTHTDEEGNEHASNGGHQFALWEVGLIPGIDGFHLNIRVIDPEFDVSALAECEVFPHTPSVVWA